MHINQKGSPSHKKSKCITTPPGINVTIKPSCPGWAARENPRGTCPRWWSPGPVEPGPESWTPPPHWSARKYSGFPRQSSWGSCWSPSVPGTRKLRKAASSFCPQLQPCRRWHGWAETGAAQWEGTGCTEKKTHEDSELCWNANCKKTIEIFQRCNSFYYDKTNQPSVFAPSPILRRVHSTNKTNVQIYVASILHCVYLHLNLGKYRQFWYGNYPPPPSFWVLSKQQKIWKLIR